MFAAQIQFHAMSAANGVQNLVVPEPHVLDQIQRILTGMSKGGVNEKSADGIEWRLGEMEFEADMRRMDLMVRFYLFIFWSCLR